MAEALVLHEKGEEEDSFTSSQEFFSPQNANDWCVLTEHRCGIASRLRLPDGSTPDNSWAAAKCAEHVVPRAEARETLKFTCRWMPHSVQRDDTEGDSDALEKEATKLPTKPTQMGSRPRALGSLSKPSRAGKRGRERVRRHARTGGGGAIVLGFVDEEDENWGSPMALRDTGTFKSGGDGLLFSSGTVYGNNGTWTCAGLPYGTDIFVTLAYDGGPEGDEGGEVTGRFVVEVENGASVVWSRLPPGCVPVIGAVNGASVRVSDFSKGTQGGLTKAARKR
jgi:hypothetical protein